MPEPVLAPSASTTESGPASTAPALALVPSPDDTARPPRGCLARRLRAANSDAGMTTAEYAVGTVAACGFGGVLYKLITSETVLGLLTSVISRAFKLVF